MTTEQILIQKKRLRQKIKSIISLIPDAKRQKYDHELCRAFFTFYNTKILCNHTTTMTILTYMPLPDEPDITGLISKNAISCARIALPVSEKNGELTLRILTDSMTTGLYNISEPSPNNPVASPSEINLAIIPARALGKNGERLGRGKGYYDRFLEKCSCTTIGLCYDEQIFDNIPMSDHDKLIDYVITPTAIYTNDKKL